MAYQLSSGFWQECPGLHAVLGELLAQKRTMQAHWQSPVAWSALLSRLQLACQGSAAQLEARQRQPAAEMKLRRATPNQQNCREPCQQNCPGIYHVVPQQMVGKADQACWGRSHHVTPARSHVGCQWRCGGGLLCCHVTAFAVPLLQMCLQEKITVMMELNSNNRLNVCQPKLCICSKSELVTDWTT